MVGKAYKSVGFLFLLLLSCTIIGSFIGYMMEPILPAFLTRSFTASAGPFPIDLKFLSMTFGLAINMNIFSIIGLIAGLVIYKRY